MTYIGAKNYSINSRNMKKKYPAQLKQFGEKIKHLRISEKLTQAQLARKCVIDTRTIQRIEGGEFAASLHTVFALAQGFNIEPIELIRDIKLSLNKKGK